MKVGIVCDSWKTPIFEDNLKRAGFDYEPARTISRGVSVLSVVDANDLEVLSRVVRAAQRECQEAKQ